MKTKFWSILLLILFISSLLFSSSNNNQYLFDNPSLDNFENKNFTGAISDLEKRIESDDKDKGLYTYFLARSYEEEKNYDKALEFYQKIIDDFSDSNWYKKSKYRKAFILAEQKNHKQAFNILKNELTTLLSPDRRYKIAEIYYNIANEISFLKGKKNNYRKALKFYKKALEIGPKNKEVVKYRIALCEFHLKKYSNSRTSLEKFLKDYPDSDYKKKVHYYLGQIEKKLGDPYKSRGHYFKVLKEKVPDDELSAKSLFQIGKTYNLPSPHTEEQLDLGVKYWKMLINKYPKNKLASKAAYQIGLSYFKFKKLRKEAVDEFLQFISLYPDSKNAPLALEKIASIYLDKNDFDKSLSYFQDFLKKYPNHRSWQNIQRRIIDVKYKKAMHFLSLKEYENAISELNSFIANYPIDSRNPAIYYTLGEIAYKQKNYDLAIENWTKTESKYPNNNMGYKAVYSLGKIYTYEKFDFEKGLEYFKKVRGGWYSKAQNEIKKLNEKQMTLTTKKLFLNSEQPSIEVQSRNIEKIKVNLYRLDLKEYFDRNQILSNIEQLDILLIEPDQSFEYKVKKYQKHKLFKEDIPLKLSEAGAYIISISSEKLKASTLLVISDLGIAVHSNQKEILIYTKNLKEEKAAANAKVYISNGKKVIVEGESDEKGIFHYKFPKKTKLNRNQFTVLVEKDSNYAGTYINNRNLQTVSDLYYQGYIFSDKPIYKPGELFSFKAILRNLNKGILSIPKDKEYKATFFTPAGKAIYEKDLTINSYGSLNGSFILPATIATGRASIKIQNKKDEKIEYVKAFQIAKYTKAEKEILFETDKIAYYPRDSIKLKISAKHLFGLPAAGKNLFYKIDRDEYKTARLDENGEWEITIDSTKYGKKSSISVWAYLEGGKKTFSKKIPIIIKDFSIHIESSKSIYLKDENAIISLETKDFLKKGISKKLSSRLYQLKDGKEFKKTEKEVETDNQGKGKIEYSFDEGGQYTVEIEGKGNNDIPVRSRIAFKVIADKEKQKLFILSSNKKFILNEKAEVNIYTKEIEGQALLTLRGNSILEHHIIKLNKGNNSFSFDIKDNLVPNFQMAVTLIKPDKSYSIDKTFDVKSGIDIKINTDKKLYSPEDKIKLKIQTKNLNGKGIKSENSIAIIDEGVLLLGGTRLEDIKEYFYRKRYYPSHRNAGSTPYLYKSKTEKRNLSIVKNLENKKRSKRKYSKLNFNRRSSERSLEEEEMATGIKGFGGSYHSFGIVADDYDRRERAIDPFEDEDKLLREKKTEEIVNRIMRGDKSVMRLVVYDTLNATIDDVIAKDFGGLDQFIETYPSSLPAIAGGIYNQDVKVRELSVRALKKAFDNTNTSVNSKRFIKKELREARKKELLIDTIRGRHLHAELVVPNNDETEVNAPASSNSGGDWWGEEDELDVDKFSGNRGRWIQLYRNQVNFPEEGQIVYANRRKPGVDPPIISNLLSDSAYYNPNVETDSEGMAEIEIPLPKKHTKWRIIVISNDEVSQFGMGEESVSVRKDFLVHLDTPLAVSEGDQFVFDGDIINGTKEKQSGTLKLAVNKQEMNRDFEVKPKRHYFFESDKIDAKKESLEISGITDLDGQVRSVPIDKWGSEKYKNIQGNVQDKSVKWIEIDESDAENKEFKMMIYPAFNKVLFTIDDLLSYSGFTFTNKVSSSLIAKLSLYNYINKYEKDRTVDIERLKIEINDKVRYLQSTMSGSGGWAWIYRKGNEDDTLSAYNYLALSMAQAMGFKVNAGKLNQSTRTLLKKFSALANNDLETKIYYLLCLSANGKANYSYVNRIYRNRSNLTLRGLNFLALTLHNMRRKGEAETVVESIEKKVNNNDFSVDPKSKVPYLDILTTKEDILALSMVSYLKIKRWNLKAKGHMIQLLSKFPMGKYYSVDFNHDFLATLAVAWDEYLNQVQEKTRDLKISVKWNDKEIFSKSLTGVHRPEWIHLRKDIKSKNKLEINLEGKGEIFYNGHLSYFLPNKIEEKQTQYGTIKKYFKYPKYQLEEKKFSHGYSTVQLDSYSYKVQTMKKIAQHKVFPVSYTVYLKDNMKEKYFILEDRIPAGMTLLQNSIKGQYSHYKQERNKLFFYIKRKTAKQNYIYLNYQLVSRFKGDYRTLAPKFYPIRNQEKVIVGKTAKISVEDKNYNTFEDYKFSPDEHYHISKFYFDKKDYKQSKSYLEKVFSAYTLKDKYYKEACRMLLYIHIALDKPQEVVKYFELLKERYPSLTVAFKDIIKIANSYATMDEYERASQVLNGTIKSYFLQETAVSGVLSAENRIIEANYLMEQLVKEYPDYPIVLKTFYTFGQELYLRYTQLSQSPDLQKKSKISTEKLYDMSKNIFQYYIVHYPNDFSSDEVGFTLLNLYLDEKKYDNTINKALVYAKRFPKSNFLDGYKYIGAHALFGKGDYKLAKELSNSVAYDKFPGSEGQMRESENKSFAQLMLAKIFHHQKDFKRALEEYEKIKNSFEEAERSIEFIKEKKIYLKEVNQIKLDEKNEIDLTLKGVKKVALKLYKVNFTVLCLQEKDLTTITEINLSGIKPFFEKEYELLEETPYLPKKVKIKLPIDKVGAYLLVFKTKDVQGSGIILKSNLSFDAIEDGKRARVTVTDEADQFIKDVQIKFIGSNEGQYKSFSSDLRGSAEVDQFNNLSLIVGEKDGHYCFYRSKYAISKKMKKLEDKEKSKTKSPAQSLKSEGGLMNIRKQRSKIQESNRAYWNENYQQADDVTGVQIDMVK